MGLRLAHLGLARALVVTMLGLWSLSSARAEEAARGPLALHWVRLPGAEKCIAGDALARGVESKLRRSVFPAPRDASILIEGHVEKSAEGFTAELEMRDAQGEALGSRNLSSRDTSCRELSETLIVVLAVMIDPDAAKRPPSAVPVEAKAKPIEQAGARSLDNRFLGFARIMVGIARSKQLYGGGAAYERALGVAGGLRVEFAVFSEYRYEQKDASVPGSTHTPAMGLRVAYGGLAYCPLWLSYTRVRLAGCAGAELGAMQGHDDGFPATLDTPDQVGLWGSGSLNLRLSFVLYGALEAHVAGGAFAKFGSKVSFTGPQGKTDDILPKTPSAPIGGVFDLGLGARF